MTPAILLFLFVKYCAADNYAIIRNDTMVPPAVAAPILRDILFPYLLINHSPESEKARRLFTQAVENLRRLRTTRNPYAWVEEAPGVFKSDYAGDSDRHTKHLYTLLAIKDRREHEIAQEIQANKPKKG